MRPAPQRPPLVLLFSQVIEVFNTGLAIWSWRFKTSDPSSYAESTLEFDSEAAAWLNAIQVLGQMASAAVEAGPASKA